MRIEPKFYLPILPMVLINGAEGIGTGWSTFIPNHDPMDVIRNLESVIHGRPVQLEFLPSYNGFNGEIDLDDKGNVISHGIFTETDTMIRIRELPIRTWTQSYKDYLFKMLDDIKVCEL